VREWIWNQAQILLARKSLLLIRIDDEALQRYFQPSHNDEAALPADAAEYLQVGNPRLTELRAAYAAVDSAAVVPTQWNDAFLKRNLTLTWFRGDNAFAWQLRMYRGGCARTRNYLALLDIESRDRLGLFDKLDEDGLFGAFTFCYGKRGAVSRDLLDSINEINYLNDRIGLAEMKAPTVLDIGAGYGRLAHRMSDALPNLGGYDCADAVPVSTFLCEYYLRFRGVPDTVRVVPLSEVDTLAGHYTVAVNVHSFSECSHASIKWWLARIAERNVEWLLIVPNTPERLLSTELDGSREDFMPDVLAAGYEVADQRPVHESAEMRDMIGVHDEFVLFKKGRQAIRRQRYLAGSLRPAVNATERRTSERLREARCRQQGREADHACPRLE
jgi:hypothetical protein